MLASIHACMVIFYVRPKYLLPKSWKTFPWENSFCKNFPPFYFRAKNHFGSVTHNYTPEVTPVNPLTSHGPLAIVTGISPQNTSLHVGQSGELTCTVKSHDRPHIKWLKEVSGDFEMTSEAANILNVKDNRYQILPTADDIKVNSNDCKIAELYCWLLLTVDGNLASVTVKTKATGPIWFWDDNYLLKYRGWPVGLDIVGLIIRQFLLILCYDGRW